MNTHEILHAVASFIDRFIPVAIKADSHAQLVRARVLVTALLLGVVITILAEIPGLAHANRPTEELIAGIVITLFTLGFYVGCLLVLRRTASLILAGNLYGLGVFGGLSSAVAVTGGFEKSPFLQILIIVPLVQFLICGRRWGYAWTLVIIGTFTVFLVLPIVGIQLPDIARPANQNIIVYTLWVVLCISLMTCLAIYDSISERLTTHMRHERDKFEHEAAHDLLTGLANRRTYHRVLELCIDECKKSNKQLALLIIDLDGFKPINDRLGHHAGDYILQVIADRLRNVVRSSDTVARLGGDEFAVILQDIKNGLTPQRIAQAICEKIPEPIVFEHEPLCVNASIGIACYPKDAVTADELTKSADSAMYSEKQSSRAT